ncbi:MAG: DUF2079 domain-containing protein [Pirellula sp.]|nr:DUF2079 domain-containing protein [Pirellula sp.]
MSRLLNSSKSIVARYSTELAVCIAIIWLVAGVILGSRLQNVFLYDTIPTLPPSLEPFGAPNSVLTVLTVTCLVAIATLLIRRLPFKRDDKHAARSMHRETVNEGKTIESSIASVILWGVLSTLPVWLCIARSVVPDAIIQPTVWEVIWFAFASSRAAFFLAIYFSSLRPRRDPVIATPTNSKRHSSVMIVICVLTAAWWFSQSLDYYQSFRLGFNDFAHFSQRVANTSNGRGFLLETPVLPTFWDHFNPGLLLLVPLWKLWPSVHIIFLVQAVSLTLPAWLLYSIAFKKGETSKHSLAWGCIWLLYPSIGQMNLSYTYGWHPITMSLPFLLLGFRLLMSDKNFWALLSILIAMSFEEGVIVVVGCFALAMSNRALWTQQRTDAFGIQLSTTTWGIMWLACVILFLLVYSFSGLAPFQAGRFAKLGNNLVEVILSPLLRPGDFWGLLFRSRNAVFLAIFFLPAFVSCNIRSVWYLGAVAFPFGVLLVWEHMPAQSIAFQYTACLLPILSLASMASGPCATTKANDLSGAMHLCKPVAPLVAVWILTIYVGQFPWSQATLTDVLGKTYGFDSELQRLSGAADNEWVTKKIRSVLGNRSSAEVRVLATGRIAAHCVGIADIETVGQFWQRRESLAKLDPELKSPLLRYDFLLIDYQEDFQQSTDESKRIATEAQSVGFELVDQQFNFAIYRRK